MRPFITIARPHEDVLKNQLTMDIFAADLWQVHKGEAPAEYKDPVEFFKKTYLTKGIAYLIDVVKKRLEGKGGDPVIQLQTPFGGGKTHSLIALYHKAKTEFKSNVVVLTGTAFDPRDTALWEEIERQLTGKVELFRGQISPGKEKLKALLEKFQPLLILMDEILEYTTRADGVKVGNTTLGTQTVLFMQELTETLAALPKAVLVFTLPSSLLEHYDENAEKRFQQLQKVVGRMEKILTPVEDEEVAYVIRRRLFSHVDEKLAEEVIQEFIDYAEKEEFLTVDKTVYREKFKASYPFQPEVIDVLYKRWGSFSTFQRTRGVLRLLGLVVHSLKDSQKPFIRLGDFDLENEQIRAELIKHIGPEFNSVIAADITSEDSGAKKVDGSLGSSYIPYKFGTKVATTIFMYSFSGGHEKGATQTEIKLSCAEPGIQSSIIVETIDKLRDTLFYLSDSGSLFFFTNKPNLNRILINKMDAISVDKIVEVEEELLRGSFKKSEYFEIYIWPNHSRDIPDTEKLKLIILRNANPEMVKEFIENYGDRPRIYRNSLLFLCPLESEKGPFEKSLKEKLAWQEIEKDRTLELSADQKERVKSKINEMENKINGLLRKVYCIIYLPQKDEPERIDLGLPTSGVKRGVVEEIYNRLKDEGKIVEKLSGHYLKDKYLREKAYVETKNILDSFYKIPGEIRIRDKEVLVNAIKEGVRQGFFGLGYLENGEPDCKYLNTNVEPNFEEEEILINPELCVEKKEEIRYKQKEEISAQPTELTLYEFGEKEIGKKEEMSERIPSQESRSKYKQLYLKLRSAPGKLSDIVKAINLLRERFENVNIKIEISAKDGEMLKSEYEDKIKEAINQLGLEIEEEKVD
jgi:hypothetical protein